MLISLNWLSDHLDLKGLSVEELSRLLTFAGVEVEGIEHKGVSSDRVVVAQILESAAHPDADKLSVCRVDGGQGGPWQIVCGAKNFKVGDKVPLALDGAVLPGDFKIKKGKLRGVESQGMMCSGKELGLGDDHDGLLILPADAPIGKPLGEYLGSDTLVEIEVTPNRPDLLSHFGLARELSALRGVAMREANPGLQAVGPGQTDGGPTIQLRSEACPYYTARLIRGVKVGPSPAWLKAKLESIGLRPINVVVDITNYILHDLGQPLHAFDLGKLRGGVIVRHAVEREAFKALDENTYLLTPDDLVIADHDGPVALAGVMGGTESGVTAVTTDVLLESAYFVPASVRRTSRRLGLTSDSSYRFERGVDPAMIDVASERAAQLIVELAGGTVDGGLRVAGTCPNFTGEVPLSGDHVRKLLGSTISNDEIAAILAGLGLRRQESGGAGHSMIWAVPSHRQDLRRPVDLIEEVARVAGLDGIPSRTEAPFATPSADDVSYDFQLALKTRLAALGFCEAQTIKLISSSQLNDSLGIDRRRVEPLALKNPLSEDHTHARPSLLPGLLAVAAHNARQGAAALRFFEVGTVFAASPNPKAGSAEAQALAIMLSGPHAPSSWLKKGPYPSDIFDLRGVLEQVMGRPDLRLKKSDHPLLVLGAEVMLGGKVVGLAGQVQPARARALDAPHPIFVAELNLAALEKALGTSRRYAEIPRFPASTRDVALEVAADFAHGQIDDFFARQVKEPLLVEVALFDVFSDPEGIRVPAGRKSLAYSLTYRDPGRTLESSEVDAVHRRVVDALTGKLPVSVR
ncbi:MAG: phenylalanine--tRNA ligase subunit beta [Verrucomicrobiales bacterium]